MRWVAIILVFFSVTFFSLAQSPEPSDLTSAETTLRQAKIKLDSDSLVQFFQDRTLSKEEQTQITQLVEKLGAPSYGDRVKASVQILKFRDQAIPFLVKGLKSDTEEIVARSTYCLREISQTSESPLILAAVQVLAHRHPPQTTRVLLDYLPFTTNPLVIDQIRAALKAVIHPNAKPPSELVKALKAPCAVKRMVAGEALAPIGQLRPQVIALLQDPEPEVRLHVALALARAEEKQAIPVLISLLDQLSLDKAWQAEDTLLRLVEGETPQVYLGAKTKPKEVRQAWQAWWKTNKDNPKKIDLAKLNQAPPFHGYTLVAQMGLKGGLNGEVLELDKDGQTIRWKITGLRYPVDAKVIGSNRVLISEYFSRKITERNFEGRVLWSYNVNMPVCCQRLPNGCTFIVSRRELLVVDRKGNKLFSHFSNGPSFVAGQKLRNGQVVFVNSGGQLVRLDVNGKELSRFFAGNVYSTGGNIQALPNGRILVPHYRENKVVEYSPSGKRVWEASVPYPSSATRLPNGHTLVVSLSQRKIVELNRQGKTVWQHRTEGRPWCAVRR